MCTRKNVLIARGKKQMHPLPSILYIFTATPAEPPFEENHWHVEGMDTPKVPGVLLVVRPRRDRPKANG